MTHTHHHHVPAPLVMPDPSTPPVAAAAAFSDLGLTFDDAARALEGGLWQNVVAAELAPGRASNDNLLDIIDVVQGDANLLNMANHGGVSGFTPFGNALNPNPKYMDNDAQTNFWANFIAQSDSLGQHAIAPAAAVPAAPARQHDLPRPIASWERTLEVSRMVQFSPGLAD